MLSPQSGTSVKIPREALYLIDKIVRKEIKDKELVDFRFSDEDFIQHLH